MAVADTIKSMRENVARAYDAAEEKKAAIPENKNIENLAETIESITGGGPAPSPSPSHDIPEFDGGQYGAIAYILPGEDEVKYYTAKTVDELKVNNSSSEYRDMVVVTLEDGTPIIRSSVLAYSIGSADTHATARYFLRYFVNLEYLYGFENMNIASVPSEFLNSCYSFNQRISFPKTIVGIGGDFLNSCRSFNQPLSIPDGVTSIGVNFLRGCASFNQPVTVPNQVRTIGGYFLGECTAFNSPVVFPDTIDSFGESFMRGDVSFNQPITLPDGISKIPGYFFYGCREFNQPLSIPGTVASTDGPFLEGCYCFNSHLELPESLLTIGNSFLEECPSFNQLLLLPQKLTSIGNNFLTAARSFNQPLEIPNSVTSIGTFFLSNAWSMISPINVNGATPPTGANSLAQTSYNYAPMYAIGITLEGENAQAWADALPNSDSSPYRKIIVKKPAGAYGKLYYTENEEQKVLPIDDLETFNLLGSLSQAYLQIGEKLIWKMGITGFSFGTEKVELPEYFLAYTGLTSLEGLEDCGTTTIPASFLRGCPNFNQEFTLPSGITSIGYYFMNQCSSFNQPLTIPSSVQSIGSYAFQHCSALNQPITFSDGLQSIGNYFMEYCTAFAQPMNIPDTVTSVGFSFMGNGGAFTGPLDVGASSGVESSSGTLSTGNSANPMYATGVTLTGANAKAWKDALPDSASYPFRKLILGAEPEPEPGEWGILEYTDGGQTKKIQLQSEEDYNKLGDSQSFDWSIFTINGERILKNTVTGYTFGSSPTTTPDNFLSYCEELTELKGLETSNLVSTGDWFLNRSPKFNQPVVLPSSLQSIGNGFISGTGGRFNQTISIPESVTSIGSNFLAGQPTYNQPIILPPTLTNLGNYFLYNCTSFNQPIELPSGLKEISPNFLSGCSGFNQPLTIPNGVTKINGNFLYNCSMFNSSLTLGQNLASIGSSFLDKCSAFAQPLTIPDNVSSIGGYFMNACKQFTGPLNVGYSSGVENSTWSLATSDNGAPLYVTGVTLTGNSASTWKSMLPDSDQSPYRKLILG